MNFETRKTRAEEIAKEAGALALDYFQKQEALTVEAKGHQDFVSDADRKVELLVRARLEAAFPDDAIVGEEHDPKPGTSGLSWVIDPIDGTSNFITAMPFWCVVIAGVARGKTQIAVIHDPNHGETFCAVRGQVATLNGAPMSVRKDATLTDGTVSVGLSRRSAPEHVAGFLRDLIAAGGVFHRLGSGALGLAYVAAGRYLGHSESFMNAWDCLAGQLLIECAGGQVEEQDADEMIASGGRVVAAAPGVFTELQALTDRAFGSDGPGKP